jgi:hypothetical protein
MAELSKIRKNGVDYDIKDTTAREAIKNFKPNASVELDTSLTQDGMAADAKAVGDKLAEITGVSLVEPAYEDRPKFFFGAPLQQTKDELVTTFSYRSKTLSFDCYAEIKAQGNSTLNWPKKNQTIKLYKDAACTEKFKVDFKGWGKQNKFVIKANWRDLTHVRDIVSVRLEGDCMRSNPDFDELPELLKTSPNLGGIDGFPVVVYAAGVYQGRYMCNIPKDKWMTNMDDELNEHCILCSENYKSGCFRAAANINGSDWTDEIHDTVPASIKTRWNQVISFVMNSTDDEFVANLDSYIKVSTLIDRHLMGLLSCDYDGYGKNQLYITYDGQQWYADRYDKDGTWGNYWNGNSMLPSNYGREQYEDFTSSESNGSGNLLFIRLEQLFWERLQTRWAELRDGVLSIPNIINRFRELYDITPPYVIDEDYASTTANGKFTGIPNKTTCTIQQIQKFVVERHAWMDEYVAGLTPVVPVPCTGITLNTETLTFTAVGTQTLIATVTPDGCTDAITWESDHTDVATVVGGVVTAIANGSATITAKCGAYSASCAVSVSGIESGGGESGGGESGGGESGGGESGGGEVDVTPVYSLAEPTTFNGTSDFVDTGVKLYDTEKDWTIILAADLTQNKKLTANMMHCVKEERPWPGVCVYLNRLTDDPATSVYDVGGNAGAGAGQTYLTNMPATATKLAIRCTGGKIDKVAYLNAGEITSKTPGSVTYTAYDGNLLLGCYQDTSGKKDRFWQGTISQCDVYFAALSDAKIETLLN